MKRLIYIWLLIALWAGQASAQDSSENARQEPTTITRADSLANESQNQEATSVAKTNKPSGEQSLLQEAAEVVNDAAETTFITAKKVIAGIIIFLFTWLIIRVSTRLLESFSERSARHRITIKGFIPILSILFWMLATYVIIVNVFSPPRETLFAGLASIGLALGFAAQDILKNIFAGVVILFDRPFRVGDKIEVGDHYGEVITIGLRSTKIVTPDDSMVTIPNSEAMNTSVSNSNTGEPYCQVVAEVYLPPNIDTVKVRKLAIEAAQVSKYIYLNKPIVVLFFNEIHDGVPFYKMRLKAYVMDIRSEFAFKSDMTELVIRQLYSDGVLDDSYYLNHGQ